MNVRLAAGLAVLLAGPAFGQSLAEQPTKPLAELLGDGYQVVSTVSNGRPGEIVYTLRREAKHYACVVTDLRGSGYSDPKAKPAAQACVPLN